MKKLIILIALLASSAFAQTCGTVNYFSSEADYVACTSANPVKPIVDGTPSTSDTHSRYQWNIRSLLENETYASQLSDAPNDVTVAVIDTYPGSQGHPDLTGVYLTGINLIEGGTNVNPGTWDGTSYGNSHGQCAAGIIAAEHNSIGTAGVFHRARIMPIRSSFATLPDAIDQAVAAGAKVIHIAGYVISTPQSYFTFPEDASSYRPSFRTTAERDANLPILIAIRAAINAADAAGVVVTQGIGNRAGSFQANFIASHPRVIAVGATNAHEEISAFNSTNYDYDIFAPGGDRREFAWSAVSGLTMPIYAANLDDPLCPMGPSSYGSLTLGSAAAPHVAAAAAIVKSYKPTATAEEVRQYLYASTRTPTPNLSLLQSLGGLLSLKKLKANLVP